VAPFALLILLVAVDRLMASERLASLSRVRPRWLRARAIAFGYVRSAPATYAYLFVLLITSWVLQTSSAAVANRLLLERSTNLHHLARDPVRVLFASAFWLPSGGQFFLWLLLLSLVAAPFERRLGARRTIAVFAVGHVFATLLTALGLWVALRVDAVEHSVVNARDVGASYGFFALAGCLGFLVDRRLRTGYLAALVGFVVALAAVSATFTDFGHLLAVALGLACYPLIARGSAGDPVGRWAVELVLAHRRGGATSTLASERTPPRS